MKKEGFSFENVHDPYYDKEMEVSFVYEEMQKKQRKLRLLKSTLEHREMFLKLQQDILEKIKEAGSDPGKISRLENRLQAAKEDIAALRKKENELETAISEHLGDYIAESDLVDGPSPSKFYN